jgi:hypothetical protein
MGIEISKNAIVNVSADRLWSILANDFDKIGEWASGVDSSGPNTDAVVPEGASVGGRICQVPGFGAVNEAFTSFNPVERSFSFEATASEIPSFVRNLTNNTVVKSLGPERSEVQIRTTADIEGVQGAQAEPELTRQFSQGIDGALEDLKIFAESGKISSQKSNALANAGR